MFAGKVPFVKAPPRRRRTKAVPGPAAPATPAGSPRKPAIPLIIGIAILGALALPATGLKLALPSESTGDPATSSRQAYDLVSDAFGPGRNAPLLVVVDAKDATVPARRPSARWSGPSPRRTTSSTLRSWR